MFRDGEDYGGTKNATNVCINSAKRNRQSNQEFAEAEWYTVKDIQGAMGFENPQAVYKWLSGRSLPSIDNFIILSRLLHTSIEDILVIDGDIVRLWSCYLIFYKNQPFFEKNILQ